MGNKKALRRKVRTTIESDQSIQRNQADGKSHRDLWDDMKFYAGEAYTKQDVSAGLKLLAELAGLGTLIGVLVTALTVWLPGIGLAVSSGVIFQAIKAAVQIYGNLNEEDRKSVRAVVSWLKGGQSLFDIFK